MDKQEMYTMGISRDQAEQRIREDADKAYDGQGDAETLHQDALDTGAQAGMTADEVEGIASDEFLGRELEDVLCDDDGDGDGDED